MKNSLKVGLAALSAVVAVGTVGVLAAEGAGSGSRGAAPGHPDRRTTWHFVWADSDCDGAIAIVYGASGDELGRTTPDEVDPVPPDYEPCAVEYQFFLIPDEAPFTVRVSGHTWTFTDEETATGPLVR